MLCDIEMPMESGLDLLDWLRQRGMTTRCIFLTAHAEFRYAQEALRLGGFDYIMQPAPYEQVADAVSRALENVKEERAALELQSRGAVFDDQKKEIVETMLRGFLLGNAPGSSLTAFEELSLVPRRERECWVALMQLAAADLVISRAGALTLAELEAVGRAAVLIPSPNVAENHQYYNAMELQKAGAAVVIEEKDLTGEKLVQTVSGMLAQPGKLAEMGRNARSLSVDDSLDRIADALLKLVKTP